MRNLKIFVLALFVLAVSTPAFASVGWKANGTPHGAMENFNATCATGADCSTQTGVTRNIPVLDSSLAQAGTGNGGATSVASTTAAVPTSFAFVRKVIPSNTDPLFTAGTLANGKPGQILTLYVVGLSPSGATTGGSYTITPTTTTGFVSVKVTAVHDKVILQFIDSTVGWMLLDANNPNATNTITVTLKG